MILTDHYRFEKLAESKSKHRFDATAGGNYPTLEQLRNKDGKLFIYHTPVPEHFRATAKRKADYTLSKSTHISSLFVPDVVQPYAYGDCKGTTDAFLLIWDDDHQAFDLLIARGQKYNSRQLYFMLCDGQLNDEINSIKKQG